MKHFITCLACCFGLISVHAQLITPDLSFGEQGYVNTFIRPNTTYGTAMERTIDNQLLLLGSRPGGNGSNVWLTRYSLQGDSISSLQLPTDTIPSSSMMASALAALPDGSTLITTFGPKKFLKLQPNGSLDSTFGLNGAASLFDCHVQEIFIDQQAGRILAIGQVLNTYNAIPKGGYVMAYDLNGRPDSSFGVNGRFHFYNGGYDFFYKIIQKTDGKLLVAGFSTIGNIRYNTLLGLTQNGTLDTDFGTDGSIFEFFTGNGENYGMFVQPDQKIVTCGYTLNPYQAVVARYLPDGNRDNSFGINGVAYLPDVLEATDMLLLPNGKILVYGWWQNQGNYSALIQLLPDGAPDPSFGVNGVYFSPFDGLQPPMKMELVDNNRIIGCGMFNIPNTNYKYLHLQGFLLDLNVGVVTPQAEPAMWVYPNPIGASCQVGFTLESAETVALDLFDMQGKLLSTLLPDTRFESGEHQVPVWLGESMAPGTYVVRITVRGQPSVAVQVVKR